MFKFTDYINTGRPKNHQKIAFPQQYSRDSGFLIDQ